MTEDLYTPNDKKRVREILTKEQNNLCAITGLPMEKGQQILEHAHDSDMFVRGVASRQANSALGVLERAWVRYLRWWYNGDLPTFLRQCADYLERKPDKRWRHDAWIKRLCTDFASLNEASKKSILGTLEQEQGGNSTQRKALFKKAVLSRKYTFDYLKDLINQESKQLVANAKEKEKA